jgi:phosphatidate phosphatase APP1
VPSREFGTARALVAAGRVLLDPPLPPAGDADSAWRNLLASYRRFESDEVPGARVRLSYGGDVRVVTTDGEGHFRATLSPTSPAPDDRSWHEVRAELLPSAADDTGDVAMLPVLVPSRQAAFGIISDIDDTVVRTDATQLLRMIRTVFLGNARTRLPFPGVAAFYRALRRGPAGVETNPLFYVSGGPWNLYELLVEFFAHQGIPIRSIQNRVPVFHSPVPVVMGLVSIPLVVERIDGDAGHVGYGGAQVPDGDDKEVALCLSELCPMRMTHCPSCG